MGVYVLLYIFAAANLAITFLFHYLSRRSRVADCGNFMSLQYVSGLCVHVCVRIVYYTCVCLGASFL